MEPTQQQDEDGTFGSYRKENSEREEKSCGDTKQEDKRRCFLTDNNNSTFAEKERKRGRNSSVCRQINQQTALKWNIPADVRDTSQIRSMNFAVCNIAIFIKCIQNESRKSTFSMKRRSLKSTLPSLQFSVRAAPTSQHLLSALNVFYRTSFCL